jgi:ribosomal protein RSM22 (predicted rRNA methylase)
MLGKDLVRPLEEDWRDTLDAVAAARGWPTTRDIRRLSTRVADLSAAYNDPARARARIDESGAARLSFSFPRDVPKGAAAVREVVALNAIEPETAGVVRVLDVGAGLGAMTWGVARALDAAGARLRIEATWVDADPAALGLGEAILRQRGARAGAGAVELAVRTVSGDLSADIKALKEATRRDAAAAGPYDLVIVGQLLSELDVGLADDERVRRHAGALTKLLEQYTARRGLVVVIEPALRDRTRHLHRVRDALEAAGAVIFAPCLHRSSCPALAQPGDWCHEDLAIDLPSWLVPIARAAGLRHQGLTFSYLVLRNGGPRLSELLDPRPGARLRVVSARKATKGKSEAFLCGEFSDAALSGTIGTRGDHGARVSVARLDRDAVSANAAWEEIARGDIVVIEPPLAATDPRVRAPSSIELIGAANALKRKTVRRS